MTRWGTWVEAALYYAEHLKEIKQVVNLLDKEEAESIAKAQETLGHSNLKRDLTYIKTHFSALCAAITKLQGQHLVLNEGLEVFENIGAALEQIPNKEFWTKFKKVKKRNADLKLISKISKVIFDGETLEDEDSEVDDYLKAASAEELAAFKFAPVTSVDVERTFSIYKQILDNRRQSFHFDNLKKYVVLYCNQKMNEM